MRSIYTERHLSGQRVAPLTISQVLLGIGGVATSNSLRSEGYNSVQVAVRADRTFTVRVFGSNDGTNWMLADLEASAIDLVSGESVVLLSSAIDALFSRVTVTNTSGVALTVFDARAYLIPHGGAGGGSGGGVGVLDNVVGGSGAVYPTIADALIGETPFAAIDGNYVPQAGTTPSVIVGQAGMSAVDDFYKDWYIVNNSGASATNGMTQQFARVSSYVGATRTLTIDKPLNFVAETLFYLVKPAYVSLLKDRVEDVTLTAPTGVVLELTGHRLEGLINVISSTFVRVTNGDVTNGIDWSGTGGVLWLENCNVSRRDETIYSVLVHSLDGVGRVVLSSCDLYGRVAGRMGRCGWEIQNCRNWGVADTANGVPYALVEAIAGLTITVTQVDIIIDSEFSGAFFYSEGAAAVISGATAYLSVQGSIRSNRDFFGFATPTRRCAIARAVGAGVITMTVTTGAVNVDLSVVNAEPDIFQAPSAVDIPNYGPTFAVLALQDATGASTLTVSYATLRTILVTLSGHCHFTGISVEGTATMTGSGVLAGTSSITAVCHSRNDLACGVTVFAPMTGSATFTNTLAVVRGNVAMIYLLASQTAGAPAVTANGVGAFDVLSSFRPILVGTGVSVSVGTYLVSGAFISFQALAVSVSLPSTVSGGTFTVSAGMTGVILTEAGTVSYLHAGTGGTLTISGAQTYVGGRLNAMRLASATGAGATVINSGATITLESMVISQTAGVLARATTATSVARCTGTVLFAGCVFESAMTMLTSTVAGSVAEGPSSLQFENCDFRSTWNDRLAADLGTFTWATATLRWKNSHIEGLVTVLATSFTTVEAIETRFSGNATEKSITATGTRPTTYRFWSCSFAARFDDLLPEVINDYDILPAAAALVQGQPVTNNAANQYVVCVAASIVRGTSLDAPAGAASRVVAVRSGRIFAAVNAAVVNGDNLGLDIVTPTQYTVVAYTPGQNAGFALEAAGATVAGKAYSQIDQR